MNMILIFGRQIYHWIHYLLTDNWLQTASDMVCYFIAPYISANYCGCCYYCYYYYYSYCWRMSFVVRTASRSWTHTSSTILLTTCFNVNLTALDFALMSQVLFFCFIFCTHPGRIRVVLHQWQKLVAQKYFVMSIHRERCIRKPV